MIKYLETQEEIIMANMQLESVLGKIKNWVSLKFESSI